MSSPFEYDVRMENALDNERGFRGYNLPGQIDVWIITGAEASGEGACIILSPSNLSRDSHFP